MKSAASPQDSPARVVGHRRIPADGLRMSAAGRSKSARAWAQALGGIPIPRGVYRFRTHEEADEWLWQMLTRPRR